MNDKQYTICLFVFMVIGYFFVVSLLCIYTNSIIPLIFSLPAFIFLVIVARYRYIYGVDN